MVARKPTRGVGPTSFNVAFPAELWERTDTFLIETNGTDTVHNLYRRKDERSINPQGIIVEVVYDGAIKWAVTSKGKFWDMDREFLELREKWGLGRKETCGTGYDSFDKAFPHAQWVQAQHFGTKSGIEYNLWIERKANTEPRAVSVSCWTEPDGQFLWKVEQDGLLSQVKGGFAQLRADHEYIPPKPVDPYAENPRYGRF